MKNPVPLDAMGNQINIGDLVCYTTNARESGLNFGIVSTIKASQSSKIEWDEITQSWESVPYMTFRIMLNITDAFGREKFHTTWEDGRKISTGIPKKSGQVHHSAHKFLRL